MANLKLLKAEDISPIIQEYFHKQNIHLSGTFELAGEAGSGRKFYRIPHEAHSWILMVSPQVDADFARFTEYSRFFGDLKLPTPQIFIIDKEMGQVLQEDFGSIHLFDLVRKEDNWEFWYEKVIESLINFQRISTAKASSCPTLFSWQFDFKGLRWETSYFTDNYLKYHQKLKEEKLKSLEEEFDKLAVRVSEHPRVVMHRDFQSQNILIYHGKVGIIDFQGARMGSVFYDLASLLWDPYTELKWETIKVLFDKFYLQSLLPFFKEKAAEMFLEASLQRLMQACGAYCFLSEKKGIASFKKYLKPGLERIKLVLEKIESKDLLNLKSKLLEVI